MTGSTWPDPVASLGVREGRVHLQLLPTLCRDSGYAGARVEAVAAPEATKAEGKPKRAVPQGQKRQDQQAAS
jgi:hypothetical protein